MVIRMEKIMRKMNETMENMKLLVLNFVSRIQRIETLLRQRYGDEFEADSEGTESTQDD